MKKKQEERIKMMPNSASSGASSQRPNYQRSVSYRNDGSRRMRRMKSIESSTLRGSVTNDVEEKHLVDKLITAININDIGQTNDIIGTNNLLTLVKLRFKINVTVRRSEQPYLETGVYIPSEMQSKPLEVTLLQLAILLGKDEIVKMILVKDKEASPTTFYEMVLESESRLHVDDVTKYNEIDQMLHESTAFHLAAKFHTSSLKRFIYKAKDHGCAIEDFIKAVKSPLGYSALHYAACNPDTESIRLLIDLMANVDIMDKRGYTPLHMAARSGVEENVSILLSRGAEVNKAGENGVTPLHRSRSLEVSKILIRHGADECLPCTLTSEKLEDRKQMTAFERAVDLQPATAEFCLDENIYTNGKDLTSRELNIIIDLGVIINSGSSKDNRKGGAEFSEMAIHQKIIHKNFTNLLEHPLSETFLVLKHQLLLGFAYWNLTLYLLFVASLTSTSIVSTPIWACCMNSTNVSMDNASSVLDCLEPSTTCHRIFWDIFSDVLPSFFWVLYFSTWTLFGLISFREMSQAYSNWHRYVIDKENWLEILMLALTAAYLATLLSKPNISPHLGALCIVFAWADFALLIGRFPSLGIYIYMSIHIMKKIVTILLSFTPILFGFALAFHILIPNSDAFDNILIANLKALAMMTGEFDFEDNFRSEKVRKIYGSDITTQVVFILFLFLVSIVISNLLIGLTVNETEIVFKSALGMRLERTFSQIAAVEDLLATSFSKGLNSAFKIKRPTELGDYLKEKKNGIQSTNSFKIYITPNAPNNNEGDVHWWANLDFRELFRGIYHPVYIYNPNTKGDRLARLELPDLTVKRIFKIISDREQSKESAPAKNSVNMILNLNEKVTNLENQLKEMQRVTEEKLKKQEDLMQEILSHVQTKL